MPQNVSSEISFRLAKATQLVRALVASGCTVELARAMDRRTWEKVSDRVGVHYPSDETKAIVIWGIQLMKGGDA